MRLDESIVEEGWRFDKGAHIVVSAEVEFEGGAELADVGQAVLSHCRRLLVLGEPW